MEVREILLMGVDRQIKIQNFALTARPNSSELYVFGGDLPHKNAQTANQLEKNKSVFKIDTVMESLAKLALPAEEEKLIR